MAVRNNYFESKITFKLKIKRLPIANDILFGTIYDYKHSRVGGFVYKLHKKKFFWSDLETLLGLSRR